MILTSSVMMKMIHIKESQKIQHFLHLTLLLLPKTFLHSRTQTLILTLQMQLKHNNLSNITTHCSQIILFYDPPIFEYKRYFQVLFLRVDYTLDTITLKQQQAQDPVFKTLYFWITQNIKPDSLTQLTVSHFEMAPITNQSVNSTTTSKC